MKRVWRWLLNCTAVASLLLLVAWIVVWYWVSPRGWNLWEFPHRQGSSYPAVYPQRYGLGFAWISPPQNPYPGSGFRNLAGFHIQWFQAGHGFMRVLVIPSWFGLSVLAMAPLARLGSMMCAKPRDDGACPCSICGYDLRATPDRCPECGTVPDAGRIGS